jgi:signal transduction histidine kinase
VEGLTSRRIAISFEGNCPAVPPAVALCVYRVAQEAIQNSIKHSGTGEVDVLLHCGETGVQLTVQDRGIGLDPGAPRGLGLVSMEERARLVQGTVEVKNRSGGGVSVELRIPLCGDVGNAVTSQEACGARGQ